MKVWMLLSVIVGSTVVADLLQSHEMKLHGEVRDFRPDGLSRLLTALALKKYLILAVAFMAASFFAFMALVQVSDLSFAVPASAASLDARSHPGAGDPQGAGGQPAVDRGGAGGLRGYGCWRCDPPLDAQLR